MKLYVVSFHDNSWGAQEASDPIIGVYSTEEKAEEVEDKIFDLKAYNDDYCEITEVELDNEEISKSNLYPDWYPDDDEDE